MKKYILKFKESKRALSEYASREEASVKLMEFINDVNKSLNIDYLSPFDFCLEEVEFEVNEVISDFEIARKALGVKPNDDYLLVSGEHPGKEHDDVERLVRELNPKHIEALVALNRLFTIAEAWNKADEFVPDFNNYAQKKWVPTFEYNDDYTGLDFWASTFFSSSAPYDVGFRLCFKTKERAEQFGKQFIELYNKAFLSNT